MKKRYVWPDVVNLCLGTWVLFVPWLNEGRLSVRVVASDLIVGVVIAVLAGAALIAFRPWQERINMVLGAWLLVSPWVLGFQAHASLLWSRCHRCPGDVLLGSGSAGETIAEPILMWSVDVWLGPIDAALRPGLTALNLDE